MAQLRRAGLRLVIFALTLLSCSGCIAEEDGPSPAPGGAASQRDLPIVELPVIDLTQEVKSARDGATPVRLDVMIPHGEYIVRFLAKPRPGERPRPMMCDLSRRNSKGKFVTTASVLVRPVGELKDGLLTYEGQFGLHARGRDVILEINDLGKARFNASVRVP